MKKKMKKIFSKLTVMVLLVSMLIPYTSIPTVEAADDWDCSEENTEYHTNYYFFSEQHSPRMWAYLLTSNNAKDFRTDDEAAQTYATSFLYNFPSDGTPMKITDADFVYLNKTGSASEITSTDEWSLKGFYTEYLKMIDGDYDYANENSTYAAFSYKANKNDGSSEDKSIVTYLIHGPWGFVGTDENVSGDIEMKDVKSSISSDSYNKANNTNVTTNKIVSDLINATVLPNSLEISKLNIGKLNLGFVSTGLKENNSAINNVISQIETYNEKKGSLSFEGIYKPTGSNSDLVLKLNIRRSYETKDFFNVNNIRIQWNSDKSHYNIVSSNEKTAEAVASLGTEQRLYFGAPACASSQDLTLNDCILDSNGKLAESNVVQLGATGSISKQESVKLMGYDTDNKSTEGNWIIAPSLFQISYKVCKASNTSADDVTLSYNGNESSVNSTNKADKVPNSQTQAKGSDFIVSATEPTLSGYKFHNWNTQSDCKGKNIEPEAKLEKLSEHTTLYACWGATNAEGPKDPLGVSTYAGLFTGIIALAGGSYYIIKKKNLFKKI